MSRVQSLIGKTKCLLRNHDYEITGRISQLKDDNIIVQKIYHKCNRCNKVHVEVDHFNNIIS